MSTTREQEFTEIFFKGGSRTTDYTYGYIGLEP